MTPDRTPNLAQDLIYIHKVISRALEVGLSYGKIYLKSLSNPKLLPGYSNYIHSFTAVLGSHHTSEDLIAFPALRQYIPDAPYNRLGADHQEIEKLLGLLPPAIKDLSGDIPQNGLQVIVDSLEKINKTWYPHISLEEHYFSWQALNPRVSLEEQGRISEASSKHSQEHSEPPYWVIPFVLYNLEPEERALFSASLPPMITNELVPKVWKDQWAPMKPFLLD